MDRKKDPELPPERFANLFRDAGINSPEALMRAFRVNNAPAEAGAPAASDAPDAENGAGDPEK